MSRWLKVDVCTPDKGEVLAVADQCGVSQGDAFLAFFRVFVWLDEQTADGWLPRVTPRMVDMRAGLDGFARAMQSVGWMTFSPEGCMVTNWGRHNGSCAKRRAQQAVRMAQVREDLRKQGLPVRPCPRPRR